MRKIHFCLCAHLCRSKGQAGGPKTDDRVTACRELPPKWRVLVLSSHTEFERSFGRPADKKRKLYNGMLKCDVFQYGK